MEITFEGRGLDELARTIEEAESVKFRQGIDKKIVTRAAENVTAPAIKRRVPRSRDNSKSGKRGYRPPGHAADNVPLQKARATESGASIKVGWTLGDTSDFFYMKFVNWGTLKMPPRDFLTPAAQETEPQLRKIAEEEYGKALEDVLGRG